MLKKYGSFCLPPVFIVAALAPIAALGQSGDGASSEDYLASLEALAGGSEVTTTLPPPRSWVGTFASTVGIPSGFVLPGGSAFIAGALSDTRERQLSDDPDGSAAIGLGFGNAATGLGFDAIVDISSVAPEDFGDSGSLNLKLGTQVPSPFTHGVASVSLGVTRVGPWGDMEDEDPGVYAVASSTFGLDLGDAVLPGMMSLGYGTNIGTLEDTDGAIFGVGLGLTEVLSIGASWYGDEAVAGALTNFQLTSALSAQIGISYGDVFQENSDGRWVLSVSLLNIDFF